MQGWIKNSIEASSPRIILPVYWICITVMLPFSGILECANKIYNKGMLIRLQLNLNQFDFKRPAQQSQKPPVTKTYFVGFNNNAELQSWITELICYFYGSLLICNKSISQLNSVLTYCIFKVLLACPAPGVPDHSHMNGLNEVDE